MYFSFQLGIKSRLQDIYILISLKNGKCAHFSSLSVLTLAHGTVVPRTNQSEPTNVVTSLVLFSGKVFPCDLSFHHSAPCHALAYNGEGSIYLGYFVSQCAVPFFAQLLTNLIAEIAVSYWLAFFFQGSHVVSEVSIKWTVVIMDMTVQLSSVTSIRVNKMH